MTTPLETVTPSIVAVKGADSAVIKAFFARLAQSWRAQGLVVAGVIEERMRVAGAGERTVLRDLTSGACFPLKQDLGSGSVSCSLDMRSLAEASFLAETAIEAGCDCVILSKFGKLEAQGGGLLGAFYAAISAEKPVVTSVSAALVNEWNTFADRLARFAKPDLDAIEAWRRSVQDKSPHPRQKTERSR